MTKKQVDSEQKKLIMPQLKLVVCPKCKTEFTTCVMNISIKLKRKKKR